MDLPTYLIGLGQDNGSANSSCPSSPAKWCTDDDDAYHVCILNPSLIPTCLLALYIGVSCSNRIADLKSHFPSRWFYQRAFFLYGIMMTSAGILHCLIGDQQASTTDYNNDVNFVAFIRLFVGVIDVGLTSNIAITLLFCGLCDIKFFNPQSTATRYLLMVIYFCVFLLWTMGLVNNWHWVFDVLYFGVVGISCGIYLLTQLCLPNARRAFTLLFAAGLYGGLGLLATSVGAGHICQSEGPYWSEYFGPQFIWFLFSDISMAFLCMYVLRANQATKVTPRTCVEDFEKDPEKF